MQPGVPFRQTLLLPGAFFILRLLPHTVRLVAVLSRVLQVQVLGDS